jgi:hypothetical protein
VFYNAINGKIKIGNTDMDFVSFGKGDKCYQPHNGRRGGIKTSGK